MSLDGEQHPLVAFIVSQPGASERLLAQHVDDGTRHCRVCGGGGQTGRSTWPCSLYSFAAEAREVERRRVEPRRRST